MINLDGLDTTELMPFWNKHKQGRNYRDLFPQGGKGSKLATADLANYASNLHTAHSCRKVGNISTAMQYERICERIYASLPDFARW